MLEEESMSGGGGEAASSDGVAASSGDARRIIPFRASPEGIVTILFTDVVGSTRLRERLGDDAAQELFHEHNRILRDQIGKHSGFEVKTYGDGFMVAFSDVVNALA
ncbi:MAG: adenylate/guanylate cyclase domain-containing protein, partial [Chloroflexota bacterium]|nr:adenylate/guanylate cyclase domain-containing protein [Chloroflexota bacterium]